MVGVAVGTSWHISKSFGALCIQWVDECQCRDSGSRGSNEHWAFIVGTYVIRAIQRVFLEKKKIKLSSLRLMSSLRLKSHEFTKHLI